MSSTSNLSKSTLRASEYPFVWSPVDDLVALDDAHDAAREVVVLAVVEPRHLGRLPADERAAVGLAPAREARDHVVGHVRRQLARGVVVEEEERARAADGDVVHAVVDEVLAHGVVPAGAHGHVQLRAHAVDRRDEHGLPVVGGVQGEKAAEGADVGEDAGGEGAPDERLDAADGLVAGRDVYAGIPVGRHVGKGEGGGGPVSQKGTDAGSG
jgi:hypothetical protein